MTVIFWLAVSYVLMSFGEYIAHRWPMHTRWFAERFGFTNIFEAHSTLHHGRFYKDFENDPDPVAKHHNITMNPLFNLLLGVPLWLPLSFVSSTGAITLITFIVVHAMVWSVIHYEMHEPSDRWWFRNPVYRWLREHHKKHHEHPSKNFNVVCPLADYIFRTKI